MPAAKPHPTRRWASRAANVMAAGAGLWLGYGFGERIGGTLLGVFVALVAALFCTILVDATIDRLLPPDRPAGDD